MLLSGACGTDVKVASFHLAHSDGSQTVYTLFIHLCYDYFQWRVFFSPAQVAYRAMALPACGVHALHRRLVLWLRTSKQIKSEDVCWTHRRASFAVLGSKHTDDCIYVGWVQEVTQNITLWSANYSGKQPGNQNRCDQTNCITCVFHFACHDNAQDGIVEIKQVKILIRTDFFFVLSMGFRELQTWFLKTCIL